MATQIPPELERPPERAKDEGGLSAFVRILLTGFAYFLMIPPWGFIVWIFTVKIVAPTMFTK